MESAGSALDAAILSRGVCRAFSARGWGTLTEFTLRSGRRADVIALAADGDIVIVEVKSSLADFLADRKWPDYADYCDRFYFAVGETFPQERLPDGVGILLSDGFDIHEVKDAPPAKLSPARRRAVTLRFALAASSRLLRLQDDGALTGR